MAIPSENARQILDSYKTSQFANLFAQSDARSVLYEVGETPDNFPQFIERLTDRVTLLAYAILSAGVSLAESGQHIEAVAPLEEAATLLNNTHRHLASEDTGSGFHVLIAAMAFYASGQYSKAFVAIKHIEPQTDFAKIIAAFLRKRPSEIISVSNPYLLADLEQFEDYENICEHAITVAISRALSLVIEYLASGKEQYITAAQDVLDTALSISVEYQTPALWWIVRLLKLMISDSSESSLWNQLPPYFPGNPALLDHYIRLLLFGKYPVMELWRSQRQALPVVLDQTKRGSVVNMRTSSGKTRLAELAMLQTLHADSSAKILYLAPFRSLAFELEQTLSQTFDWLGFHVSHLYGGFRVSSADKQLAQDSSIIIATPEKARAILRGSSELLNDIKLIVVDEGHLIGANERYVKNELFLDHLRFIANSLNCRIMLLSAVLPNPEHLAAWITGDSGNVAKSDWKPSSERFGLLRWQGNHVRIDWRGEFESFNPRFVQAKRISRQYDHGQHCWKGRQSLFPKNKNEAIAASAIRLTAMGPVLIFSGQARSVNGMAAAVLTSLGEEATFSWPLKEWKAFIATCEEELPVGAVELESAKKGVICHSNNLPNQIRIATERLMRSKPPKVIIATTTLGQGVNIGISSVIIASPYIYNDKTIDHRDFWNICGRAGRAFVDGEGKILYAIDETRKGWQIRKDQQLAEGYFNTANANPVESGLLFVINGMYSVAERVGVDFTQLLEMVAENDFSALGDKSQICSYIIDLIDGGLLAFQEDARVNPNETNPEVWVDDVFRASLAAIQSDSNQVSLTQDQLFAFLKTRIKAIVDACPDANERKAYVATGLPLSAAKNVFRDREVFIQCAKVLDDAECSPQSVIEFLSWLEEWARDNATAVIEELPDKSDLDAIRSDWILGTPMRDILAKFNGADTACKNIYGYRMPWLINAISQQIRKMGNDELADVLGVVGLLVELGVPNDKAAWIFLAGVRSRAATTELSQCGVPLGISIIQVKRSLRDKDTVDALKQTVSEATKAWLGLHWEMVEHVKTPIPNFQRFTCKDLAGQNTLIVRSDDGTTYLCSEDGVQRMAVESSDEWPFQQVANDYRFAFRQKDNAFELFVRDPRIEADKML
ncbi:MAG: DEAD/DEAH box helicase [Phycisphaerae bacterium]